MMSLITPMLVKMSAAAAVTVEVNGIVFVLPTALRNS